MDTKKLELQVNGLRGALLKALEHIDNINALLREEATPGQLAKEAFNRYIKAWENKYRTKYVVVNAAAVMAMLKKALHAMTLDELNAALNRYLMSGDRFYVEARHPIEMGVKVLNKFTAAATPTDTLFDAAPPDCRHSPRCKTDIECTRRRS